MKFLLESPFKPAGDQPKAIAELVSGLQQEDKIYQSLLGVTGSGKTFTIANVIQECQLPTLVLAHNKTLAAQLYSEFKALFPENAVEYFVSYYDYYQPEAYVPSTNTFIEKDSSINDEIDKFRHSATQSLLERKDVIIVSSVSCIYGLGSPEVYQEMKIDLKKGESIRRDDFLRSLVLMGFKRDDIDFHRGCFRVRGDRVDIFPSHQQEQAIRVEFFGHQIDALFMIDALSGKKMNSMDRFHLYPNSHYVVESSRKRSALKHISEDLRLRLNELKELGKMQEAERLESRTLFDMEMMEEVGYCQGIENYSRYLDGRKAGEAPPTLIDYFKKDWLLVVDESHVSIPQVGAMYRGDRSRKMNLVEHGFRMPSALDNRPLTFEEFESKHKNVIFVSATPSDYEMEKSEGQIVEQVIRPTGLVDPVIEIKPATTQVDDLLEQVNNVVAAKHRVLVTTLTKKMAENLTGYLSDNGIKVRYLHSDVDTLERVELLRDLRKGLFDVLVGINLLREGLDLPEVALVAILDADKEGFLRSRTALIQTVGRAARNLEGRVIFYADRITKSMKAAMDETDRRRKIQLAYNEKHGIVPKSTIRADQSSLNKELEEEIAQQAAPLVGEIPKGEDGKALGLKQILRKIKQCEKEMRDMAKQLEFERAAELRDQLLRYRRWELECRQNKGHFSKIES